MYNPDEAVPLLGIGKVLKYDSKKKSRKNGKKIKVKLSLT